ncbi:MAG: hypothetical protein FGM14_14170 [Flavobacteriales bacterium]|nr:hypothetical protein [Flavobacteriales bacterium]
MKKIILSFAALSLVLASCGGSDVCNCADTMLEMSKEMKEVKGDFTKIEAIQKKYEADFKKCEKLGEGKSEDEKKKMETELKACDSYKEMEKMMKAN